MSLSLTYFIVRLWTLCSDCNVCSAAYTQYPAPPGVQLRACFTIQFFLAPKKGFIFTSFAFFCREFSHDNSLNPHKLCFLRFFLKIEFRLFGSLRVSCYILLMLVRCVPSKQFLSSLRF